MVRTGVRHNRTMPQMSDNRHAWVAETLSIDPADRLLEVGCGHGVTASLVCERLGSGHITAIDRSTKMIEMAARRNRDHVAAGRAAFEATSLEQADLGHARFDKVFAVHVAFFWRKPAEALPIVARALARGGALYLFNQTPGWTPAAARAFGDRVGAVLQEHDFSAEDVAVGPGPMVGVRARPA
jgi:ubiquinone/menaquinone biosynthesis C-methylase UbiE